MCYTGKCKYELYFGDCSLRNNEPIPEDAACVEAEKAREDNPTTEEGK
jgi:hypothetical protein